MKRVLTAAFMFALLAVLPACWKNLSCDKKDTTAQSK